MSPTNKEVIKKLTEYYLEHEPELIARILANATIDLYRCHTYETLSIDQQVSLAIRMKLNAKNLQKFVKDGPDGKIKLRIFND